MKEKIKQKIKLQVALPGFERAPQLPLSQKVHPHTTRP